MVGDLLVKPVHCSLLSCLFQKLTSVCKLLHVLSVLDSSEVCIGNQDSKFEISADLHKSVFKDRAGNVC